MRKKQAWIRKVSTRGRVTIPRKIIARLFVVKGSRYLFKARGGRIIVTPVRPWEKRYNKVKVLNRREKERIERGDRV